MTGREHLHQIAHLARSVSSALAVETVLKKVTAAVVELLPEAGCVIRMVDEEAGGYRLAAQGGAAAEGFPPLVPFGEGLTHAVVAGRRPVLVSDGSADHIDVSLEPGEIPPVHAGSAALREVLVNLMLNAIDALPRGGRIEIRTWAVQGWVYCAVSDTGVGMTPDIQRRALEPFFTTKGVKSTGLGLSVSYGILRRHGGDITLDGGTREGTTVTFRLPVGGEQHETPPEIPAERLAPMTILVIDDELEVRATLVEMLEEQGHVVHQAAGGAEGLTALAGLRAIDVVFTDLGMPGMTGWEVARAIKARRPTLPVMLVTGWGTGSETGPERGAVDLVLAKPLTNAALRAAIAEVAGRRPPLGQ